VSYAIQGVFCELNKCFAHGKEVLYLKPGVFDSWADNDDVRLLIAHEGKSLATTADRLDIYLGDDALTFRFKMPESWGGEPFSDAAGDVETYFAASCGFKYNAYETVTIDGVEVKIISSATLEEISLVKDPAVKGTYARIVSIDACNSLEDDHNLIKLAGRIITLHRKVKALETGDEIQYSHVTTPYERASDRFTSALQALT
jgi:phage head maturation protease